MNNTAVNTNTNTDKREKEAFSEGPIAETIEHQTAKLPSDTFLWAALGSIGVSLTLQVLGKKETASFVGQWAPTLLILGLYNKLVKVAGSDRMDNRGAKSSFGSQLGQGSNLSH